MILQPSNLVRALGLPLVCLAMFSLGGGHWAILQTLAWSQMLWTYSQEDVTLGESVTKTFNGENPCALCTAVKKGRQEEKKAPQSLSAQEKVEIFLVEFSSQLPPRIPSSFKYPTSGDTDHSARSDAPPGPVPRSAQA